MSLLDLSPLEATQQLADISVTERGQFRQCRRKWNLTTLENLQPKAHDELPFEFGTGIHSALEAMYTALSRDEGEEAALESWAAWRETQELQASTQDAYERILDQGELGESMLGHYFEFDKLSKVQLGRPLMVEGRKIDTAEFTTRRPPAYRPDGEVWQHESGRLMVPIVDPMSKTPIVDRSGRVPHLTARIDLLSERDTPKRGLWIVDHKSASSAPRDKVLDLDDQATGYCYVVFRWLGELPRGVVWNVLIKDRPEEPRIVQDKRKGHRGDETLSSAKTQLTLPSMYRKALHEWGYMTGDTINSEAHADCLAALLARGWDPFFRRYELTRNANEIQSFEERLLQEYWDMVDCHDDAARQYPNPSVMNCPGCPVQSICLAIEDGSDWEHIVSTHYEVGPDRKAKKEGS